MASATHTSQATQVGINIITVMILAVLLVAPAALAIAATVYLDNIAGLLLLVGYWYAYDFIQQHK